MRARGGGLKMQIATEAKCSSVPTADGTFSCVLNQQRGEVASTGDLRLSKMPAQVDINLLKRHASAWEKSEKDSPTGCSHRPWNWTPHLLAADPVWI
jgi:hypothetical protein